jgi:peptidoglycan/LPS O-acetylase OafA/YrhL
MVLLVATCLFLAAAMDASGWHTRWSIPTRWLAFGAGCLLALMCAELGQTWRMRHRTPSLLARAGG